MSNVGLVRFWESYKRENESTRNENLKKIKIVAKITLGLLAKGNAALRALGNDKGANTRGTRSMGVYAESFLKEIFTDRKNRKEDK